MNRKYFVACAALLLATLLAYIIALPNLPAEVPIHWNFQGEINGYGPRWVLLLIGPGTIALTILLFAVLPALSPKRFALETFLPTYRFISLTVTALSAYLFAILLWAALVQTAAVKFALLGGVSVVLLLLGNVLGKVRRNFYIGVRTPWTIASERVWNATHRFAGKSMVLSAILSLVVALLGAAMWLWIAVIAVGSLAPVLYSLLYYKQLEKRGELDQAV